jgi:hypothetical protein
MSNFINKLSLSGWRGFELTLASLLLVTSISKVEAQPTTSKDFSTISSNNAPFISKDSNTLLKQKLPEKEGVYLFGHSPEPDQIGQEYIVFEMRQGKVTGAFYLPQSEFSCFQGSLSAGKLDLTIANDSNSDAYSDSIADAQNSPQVATASNPQLGDEFGQMSSSYSVALQNYHQIASISPNDKQILAACKNNYQE